MKRKKNMTNNIKDIKKKQVSQKKSSIKAKLFKIGKINQNNRQIAKKQLSLTCKLNQKMRKKNVNNINNKKRNL